MLSTFARGALCLLQTRPWLQRLAACTPVCAEWLTQVSPPGAHTLPVLPVPPPAGKAAEDAINVFYYLTYEGTVALDAIPDPTLVSSREVSAAARLSVHAGWVIPAGAASLTPLAGGATPPLWCRQLCAWLSCAVLSCAELSCEVLCCSAPRWRSRSAILARLPCSSSGVCVCGLAALLLCRSLLRLLSHTPLLPTIAISAAANVAPT